MKKSLLLFLFFIFLSSSLLPLGNLKEVITDLSNNSSLISTNVYLTGTALASAVDIEGNYNIDRIPAGTFTVKFSYMLCKSKEFNIKINNNHTTELNIQLMQDFIQGQENFVFKKY